MIRYVLHDAKDSVAVVVVEGVKAGQKLKGWITDEDKTTEVVAKQDIPIGHKVALKDMAPGESVMKYGIDMGKVVAPIKAGDKQLECMLRTANGWLTAAESPGHREFVLTRLYESA